MSGQVSSSPFSMCQLLDSGYQTWSLDCVEKNGPAHFVYVREFSEDKSEVRIRTLDWDNDECLAKARNLVGNRLLAIVQLKGDEVILSVSDKLKENFKPGRAIKIVYQGKDSSETICSPRGTAFLTEKMFAETTGFFKEFCVSSAQRRKASISL